MEFLPILILTFAAVVLIAVTLIYFRRKPVNGEGVSNTASSKN
jgi:hypothetical protein